MREGLLYDMVGRFTRRGCARAHRARDAAALPRRLASRPSASRPRRCSFWRRSRDAWGLDDPLAELALRWAARLHEIGLDVAHNGYHRHGAYLLENADMPGFPREEQQLLARLVGGHRRKLSLEGSRIWCRPGTARAIYLIVLLRLAVLLHRGRSPRRCRRSSSPRAAARWSCASRRAG